MGVPAVRRRRAVAAPGSLWSSRGRRLSPPRIHTRFAADRAQRFRVHQFVHESCSLLDRPADTGRWSTSRTQRLRHSSPSRSRAESPSHVRRHHPPSRVTANAFSTRTLRPTPSGRLTARVREPPRRRKVHRHRLSFKGFARRWIAPSHHAMAHVHGSDAGRVADVAERARPADVVGQDPCLGLAVEPPFPAPIVEDEALQNRDGCLEMASSRRFSGTGDESATTLRCHWVGRSEPGWN
jgi:hypothetical protein